jgi:hypothetical protein
MEIAEPPGGAVPGPEAPVRNMLEEHVVYIALGPIRHDAAEGAAGLFGGFLEFKKIDVLVHAIP